MREIVFRVQEHSGERLRASADHPSLTIEADTFEDLQYEAREVLIEHFGASHVAYRVRIRRPLSRIQLHRRNNLARQAPTS